MISFRWQEVKMRKGIFLPFSILYVSREAACVYTDFSVLVSIILGLWCLYAHIGIRICPVDMMNIDVPIPRSVLTFNWYQV